MTDRIEIGAKAPHSSGVACAPEAGSAAGTGVSLPNSAGVGHSAPATFSGGTRFLVLPVLRCLAPHCFREFVPTLPAATYCDRCAHMRAVRDDTAYGRKRVEAARRRL